MTDSPVLLVDIGSGGTTQRVLEELLHTQLYGCYLACDARLHQNLPPERAKTFLFDGCPAPLWYWGGQPMLEVLLSEPCGPTVGYRAQAGQMVPEIGQAGADNKAITAPLWQGMRAFVQRWQAGPLREVQIPPQTCIAAFCRWCRPPACRRLRTWVRSPWRTAAAGSWLPQPAGALSARPGTAETGPCPGALETCVFAAPVWCAAAIRQGVRCTET